MSVQSDGNVTAIRWTVGSRGWDLTRLEYVTRGTIGADVVGANSARGDDEIIPATATSISATPAPANMPLVSVVIPVYNCADTIMTCLESIFAQTYPRDHLEVILVDDGSMDGTAAIAKAAAVTLNEHLTLITQANAGPAAARNAGIRAATGEIVAFTDADCVAAHDWLECLVRAFDQHPDVAGVGGPLRNTAPSDTLVARYLVAADFYRHRARNGAVEYLLTANAAFRRIALLDIGCFTERRRAWAEDADLSFRLVQSGYVLLLSSAGVVTHTGVLDSLRDFVHGLYRYGFGNAVMAQEWPGRRRPSLQLIRHGGAAILAPWLAFHLRSRVGWRRAIAMCPLIATEHIAYSVGLVSGWIADHQWRKEHVG